MVRLVILPLIIGVLVSRIVCQIAMESRIGLEQGGVQRGLCGKRRTCDFSKALPAAGFHMAELTCRRNHGECAAETCFLTVFPVEHRIAAGDDLAAGDDDGTIVGVNAISRTLDYDTVCSVTGDGDVAVGRFKVLLSARDGDRAVGDDDALVRGSKFAAIPDAALGFDGTVFDGNIAIRGADTVAVGAFSSDGTVLDMEAAGGVDAVIARGRNIAFARNVDSA